MSKDCILIVMFESLACYLNALTEKTMKFVPVFDIMWTNLGIFEISASNQC